MEQQTENTVPESNSDNSSQIHTECLNALVKDVGINIKELSFAISRDAKIEFDEESAKSAAVAGENVYKNAVQAGKSLSSAEIEAFKTAFPNKKWNSEETWKKAAEEDINQALSDYCETGTCKRFIK